jgi:hypothetical protein
MVGCAARQCSGKNPYQVVVLLACVYFDEMSDGGTAASVRGVAVCQEDNCLKGRG